MTFQTPRIFVSDCEGPISKNDNAFELASHYIPRGDQFFTVISGYDDVLAEIIRRPGYKAGDTLKLILPFLKAYGATNESMSEYSSKNIKLMPGAKEMLQHVNGEMPSFIVSTSYEQYMRALCNVLGFPFENVHCTRLDLNKYEIDEKEKDELKKTIKEIVQMPIPEIPKNAKSLDEFPENLRKTVKRLDAIFWQEISNLKVGRMLQEVNPVGGEEKAQAIQKIIAPLERPMHDVMYVGDSITDVSAFRYVRKNGGLTVSFNGNSFAVREAEIAVISEDAVVTVILADAFSKHGRNFVLELVKDWDPSSLEKFGLAQPLHKRLLRMREKKLPKIEMVTSQNRNRLMKESSAFRVTIRGEAIGKLG